MDVRAQENEVVKSKVDFNSSDSQESIFPIPLGIINDYSDVFSIYQIKELSNILYDYDLETTRQIVVVTIDDISGYDDIQKYATDLGNEWGVGTAEKDNGLVIVLSIPLRKLAIATGSGVDHILTDEICKSVIDNIIIPEFKTRKYYDGVKKGIDELITVWDNEK
ncbi:YgcG family protein [uncultured Flavobacterium sp.]|uniref:TPM domain-containing protein n=1 Tax=uncultured Flavobacterium sp. TaxID=165435 RepID=UPI0025EB1352|nr:TPM domain-containing protein [uncultured Flavobacterium sp.]